MPVETNTPHAGATPWNSISNQGGDLPISKRQHLRGPNGHTHRRSGATVEDSHEGPLNDQRNPIKLVKRKRT
jgi:hypothetical protein